MNITLHDDQKKGIALLVESIKKGNKRTVYAAPTGYGKTVVMGYLTSKAINKTSKHTGNPQRVWIIVDAIELVNQTRDKLKTMFGIEAAVMQGQHEDTDFAAQVNVVMAQTLRNRLKIFDKYPEWLPDFVMTDECHLMYSSVAELMGMLPGVIFTGFSATPASKGMGIIYDDLIVPTTTGELIKQKRLAPIRYFSCHNPDVKQLKTSAGDYTAQSSADELDKALHGEIVPNWKKNAQNRKTLIYCSTIKQSIEVQQQFIDAGIPAYQVDGFTDKELRKGQLENFESDSGANIMVSVATMVKGIDIPDVGCICFYRITRSIKLWIQCGGRGLRVSDMYDDLIFLDFGGNIARNGFLEDYDPSEKGLCDGKGKPDTQDDGNQKEREAQICPKCKYIKPVGVNVCPECNFEPAPQRGELTTDDVEVVAGEMKEVKRTPAEVRNKETPNQDKQAFYSGLLRYARNKGYKDGWAKNKYKTRFSVWPNKYDSTPSDTIPKEVTSFITSENIRWANRVKK